MSPASVPADALLIVNMVIGNMHLEGQQLVLLNKMSEQQHQFFINLYQRSY